MNYRVSIPVVLSATILLMISGCTDRKKSAERVFPQVTSAIAKNNLAQTRPHLGGVPKNEFDTVVADLHERYEFGNLEDPTDGDDIRIRGPVKMYTLHEIGNLPQRELDGGYDLPERINGQLVNHITERPYVVKHKETGERVMIKFTIAWDGSRSQPTVSGMGVYEASDLRIDQ